LRSILAAPLQNCSSLGGTIVAGGCRNPRAAIELLVPFEETVKLLAILALLVFEHIFAKLPQPFDLEYIFIAKKPSHEIYLWLKHNSNE
jgi:hypothetical protein